MVALPLIHKCGQQVDHLVVDGGGTFGRLIVTFSDSQTDDALAKCPRCGAPLYEAFVQGEFTPPQPKPTAPSARRTGEAQRGRVRDGAAKAIAKMIEGAYERRAAKAAA
jgi:hypothetical protein